MKTKKIIQELYSACIKHDLAKEKTLWLKAIKKSLKHKKTMAIQ